MIKITFLGTNGWYDTQTGNTMCVLVQSPDYDIVLDAGNGFTKVDKYITSKRPVYLFLSHFHLDHLTGLHTLHKFNFKAGLHITGPAGLNNILNTLVEKPYTSPFSELPYPTKVYELTEPDAGQPLSLPLPLEYKTLVHPVTTFGYRFKLDNKIITYCTDTGFCENAIKLAMNSDLLIAECACKRGKNLPQWPHLNPDEAAKLAKMADAKKLVLTHFDANTYRTLEERKEAETQARETFTNTIAAVDNLLVEI